MNFLVIILSGLTAIIAGGAAIQALAGRADRRRFPAPGRIVDANGRRLHVRAAGAGSPPVVFEAGIAATSASWIRVESAVSEFTRTVSYDRAGLGWSHSAPLDAQQFTADFFAVLENAGVDERVVVVGHSFGGLLARLYAAAKPDRIAGLVLVDPALTSEWAEPTPLRQSMLDRGIRFSRRGAVLARLGVVRLGLNLASKGAHGAAKSIARASSSTGGQRTVERLVGEIRKMPAEILPAVQAHWSDPKSFTTMARHLELLPETCRRARDCGTLGDIPVVVISGGHLTEEQQNEQNAVAQLSTRGRHIVAEGSGHWVHLDQPDLIVAAIREIVAATRER